MVWKRDRKVFDNSDDDDDDIAVFFYPRFEKPPSCSSKCLEENAMSLFANAKPPVVQKVSRREAAISSNR